MSDQVNKSAKPVKPVQGNRKRRSWLRILLWAIFLLLIGLVVLAIYLWANRYSLIEQQARKELAKAGIEAEFNIESIDRTKAVLNSLKFSDEDGPFFSADKLSLHYRFEQVRAGIVDKITLKKPVLRVTLDGSGNVIDRWIPEASEESEPISVPRDGVYIEDGEVNWAAPWGAGATGVNAQIQSETSWQSQIDMPAAKYTSEAVTFDFSYVGNIDRTSEYELSIDGQVNAPSAQAYQSTFGALRSDFELDLETTPENDLLYMKGGIGISAANAIFPQFAMSKSRTDLKLDTLYSFETGLFDRANIDWVFEGDELSLTDPQMRQRLVSRTMSYDTLSKTPIAMHFADELKRNGVQFLERFDAHGSGTYLHNSSGYEVEFSNPLVLKAIKQKVVLTPDIRPEIKYRSNDNKIDLDMQVEWDSSRDINFQNLKLTAHSDNGLVLTKVDQVSTIIRSRDEWSRSVDGENIRLSPLMIALNFKNSERGSLVSMQGDIDYDGPLPGGRVNNLRTGGDIVVNTTNRDFALSFSPKGPIAMDGFISSTGWSARNISFDLGDGNDVLSRTYNAQPFAAHLNNVDAEIASPEDDRHLQTRFENLKVKSNFQSDPQVWDMDIAGIDIKSDDFPAPGTHVQSAAGTASVRQFANGKIDFSVVSPNTEISTDNVQVTDLFIEMTGRPEDFSANYKAGKVQLKGGDIPEVPMEGTARLQDGVLTGNAVAPMPKTQDTPINISYRSEEGIGSAHISIPNVVFTPRGLQPQYLIPTLRGKLAEVSGEASAEFDFAFGGGGPVQSKGTTTLKNMDIGTLVGPASGVSAELTFKSMFPLETDGVQTATLAGFDAGFPLENGTIKFEIVPDGIRIDEAIWPILSEEKGDGKIFISPMLWRFGNVENQAVVNVENLSLGEILSSVGNGSLSATGQISGQLPATINGVDVVIHDGRLAIEEGGVIRYRNQGIDTFAQGAKQPFYLGDDFAGSETGFAFKALEYFEYKELEALIDGPLDGEMTLRMLFGGKNPGVLAGTPFEFDVAVSGELGNIARDSIGAFDAQKHLDAIIDMQGESDENPK